ncbi:MAG TPA: matrixin family metalloprotease, partial [Terriglobia bacterium]|nr:matrixin family metalloprotease [Terriglobia bacterium]
MLLSADLLPGIAIQEDSSGITPEVIEWVEDAPAPIKIDVSLLEPIVEEAAHRLESLGLNAEQAQAVRQVEIKIADLPGWTLAETTESGITIDEDAVGLGWFVDQTPSDDSEFVGSNGEAKAADGSEADGRVDLLTVVAHELGHFLGFAHSDESSGKLAFMQPGPRPGIRRLPGMSITDQLTETLNVANAPPESGRLTITPTISWILPGDGFWDIAANWQDTSGQARVPTSSDDVLIDLAGSNPTITVRTGAQAVRSLLSSESIVISGGSLTVDSTSEINAAFTLSGGTLTGTGTLTVTGASTWSGGTMTGTGATTFTGALAITGGNVHDLTTRTLNLNGTTTWTNTSAPNQGRIRTGSGATINNAGSFQDQVSIATGIGSELGGAGSTFNNTGTYTKSVTATATTISIAFNNTSSGPGTGVVNASVDGLALSGGGTANSGSTFNAAGVGLTLGGSYNLQLGSAITAGLLTFVTGNNSVAGSYVAQTITFPGGSTTFTNTATGTNGSALIINGGTAIFNNTGWTASTLDLSSGAMSGSSEVVISGASTWSGGTLSGTGATTFNGAFAISGGNVHDLTSRTLNLNGTTTWTNVNSPNQGRIRTGTGATINNAGSFQDQVSIATGIGSELGGAG